MCVLGFCGCMSYVSVVCPAAEISDGFFVSAYFISCYPVRFPRRMAEVRNLMQYSTGFGVLSTNSRSLEG